MQCPCASTIWLLLFFVFQGWLSKVLLLFLFFLNLFWSKTKAATLRVVVDHRQASKMEAHWLSKVDCFFPFAIAITIQKKTWPPCPRQWINVRPWLQKGQCPTLMYHDASDFFGWFLFDERWFTLDRQSLFSLHWFELKFFFWWLVGAKTILYTFSSLPLPYYYQVQTTFGG